MELTKEQKLRLAEITRVKAGDICPHCQFGIIKYCAGKFGGFLGCSDFPNCAFSQKIINKTKLPNTEI